MCVCLEVKEVRGVRVVKGVKVICFVDSYPDLISTTFANVPADLHELLSTAKNRPEMNIRTEGQRS